MVILNSLERMKCSLSLPITLRGLRERSLYLSQVSLIPQASPLSAGMFSQSSAGKEEVLK